ncbi:MAG: protein phosphatase 2C domain-containing protein [Prevotellaceae bacterium]|jgi:serine/threonine protein phosphatase PrpC|nr:protein phosphatase 2C domain-containing protein [Prevotellaceae bacterium]
MGINNFTPELYKVLQEVHQSLQEVNQNVSIIQQTLSKTVEILQGYTALQEPVEDTQESAKDLQEPAKDLQEPAKDLQEPAKDLQESAKDLQESAKDTQKSAKDTQKLDEAPPVPDEISTESNVLEVQNTQANMKLGQENNTPENREEAKNRAFDIQIKNKDIKFPPGKINQQYAINFDIKNLGMPDLAEVSFKGLEDVGLRYFPEDGQIKGIPVQAGEHKITMLCKRNDWTEGRPVFERDINLIINHDPRSLWHNIPTPTDIEYYKPDEDSEFVKIENMETETSEPGEEEYRRKNMIAASQRGRSHAHEGKPRDDDFALNFNKETGWYTMVVADGAGSAKYSRKGSRIACETAIDVCNTQLDVNSEDFEENIRLFEKAQSPENHEKIVRILYNIIGQAAFQAYKNIQEEAEKQRYNLKDYSTTLILSISKKFDFGWFIAAFWVGDGGIGIYRKEPEYLKILGEPDGGEFAGQTRFLTMNEIFVWKSMSKRLRFDIVPDFTALVLMTDGVTDPKFETDASLNSTGKWHTLWDDLQGKNEENAKVDFTGDIEQSAHQLLKWLDFWSRGNHDDRTIAILF